MLALVGAPRPAIGQGQWRRIGIGREVAHVELKALTDVDALGRDLAERGRGDHWWHDGRETLTIKVPDAVSGGELLSETMIVIEACPVGWFDAGVQVIKPVVKSMLRPCRCPAAQRVSQRQGGVCSGPRRIG